MSFLPIVERELRVASRRGGTYWLRFWAGLGVIVFAAWLLAVLGYESPQTFAKTLFYGLTGMALVVCLLAGPWLTANSMAEEKREGTLGLLFLTDLKGYDVVLGKLVANSVHAFYALLAVLPVMAIALLLGNFTFGHVVRVALALLNALFFSLCLGMLASTISRTTRSAAALALGWMFTFAVWLPTIGSSISRKWPGSDLWEILSLASPGMTYLSAASQTAGRALGWYWASLGAVHALAWLFLILACVYAPRCWQDQPVRKSRLSFIGAWRTRLLGCRNARTAQRRRLLEQNPFYWRAARARFVRGAVWGGLGMLGAVWIWGWARYSDDWANAATYIFMALGLNVLLKLGVAAEATRTLTEERRDGTLELLLSTPLSVREILRGQALALRRVFLLPLLVTLVVEIVLLLSGLREMSRDDRPVWLSVWIAGMLMLLADLIALYWVGMWRAVGARNPRRAFGQTVGCVLVLPWVGFAALLALSALLDTSSGGLNWQTLLGLWCVLGLLADVGFGTWARHKLLTEFRLRVAERYASGTPWRRRGVETVASPGA